MVVYHLLVLLLSVMPIENRSFVNGLKHDGLSPIISLEEPVLLTSPTDRKNKASVRANKIEISILKRQIQEQQNFIRNLQEKSEAGLGKMNLRLVNGNSSREGRVEVYKDGVWGTVCDNGWDFNDAKVVCKQLFGLDGIPYSHAYFGQGTGLVLMDDVRCNGTESSLLQCDHIDNLHHSCDHSKDAGVICMKAPLIRLSKQKEFQGRVEVYMNNTWGTICDNGWSNIDASVVCRTLGYSEQGLAVPRTVFGNGSGPIHLDNVQCIGRETGLDDCPYSETHSCNHSEDAGVLCILPSQKPRLVNGSTPDEGLVEVFVNDRWLRVCNNWWDRVDSNVTCRSLGYSGGFQISLPMVGERGNDVWFLDKMDCNGDEDSLLKCARSVSTGCSYEAGVICYQTLNGQVRIGNGSSSDDGLVEVMVNDRWRRVCGGIRWGSPEANVTCRRLGFPGGIPVPIPNQRHGMKDIWHLPNIECRGDEATLLDCEASGSGSCSEEGEAGVICYPSSKSAIRLVVGSSPHEGLVEVFMNHQWRRVCDTWWGTDEANVTCKSLNYSGGIPVSVPTQTKGGNNLWKLTHTRCEGNENSLLECEARGTRRCRRDEDAGVICYPSKKGEVRLVNGDSPDEGLVQILVNGHWRGVCAHVWDKNDADVACRSIGFIGGLPISFPGTSRNSREHIWFFNRMDCDGNENSLLECAGWGSPSCRNSAGVICYKSSTATVRLVDGSLPHEGFVEVLVNGRWRSVCDFLWDKSEAKVTCGLLGYSGGIPVSVPTSYERKEEMWFFSKMDCKGNEESLSECSSEASKTCNTGKRAGALCYDTFNGTVRLADGISPNEGKVEVLVNNQWRRICEGGSEEKNAIVACRSLGYSGGVPVSLSSSNDRKNLLWLLPPMDCFSRYESSLLNCGVSRFDRCSSGQEAGVHCYHKINEMIRLVNGTSSNEGRVEVFIYGTWGTVCDYGWDDNEALVLCRSLGYSGDYTAQKSAYFGQGSGTAWIRRIRCRGRESSIFDCSYPGIRKTNCRRYRDAGVRCK
ncbi:deleted in malignant brain tumors 1 protein-like isoform X2 [Saccostrea cucullata]|uniref:deleted in malignant brain tumors 1 protein-like isoform X2 n=1 Tax=Saccostrea cuccullata TaxID=36930 RepID=UPI002ED2F5B7